MGFTPDKEICFYTSIAQASLSKPEMSISTASNIIVLKEAIRQAIENCALTKKEQAPYIEECLKNMGFSAQVVA